MTVLDDLLQEDRAKSAAREEMAEQIMDGFPTYDETDFTEVLDELVHETADSEAAAITNGAYEHELSTSEVEATCSKMASDINNQGPQAQIAFLLKYGLSEDEIRSALRGSSPAP